MPLHLEYRPSSLNDLIGNEAIKISLQSILGREKDRPHSYLLYGPSGCGKTTIARIIASMLGCAESALSEYNCSDSTGVDFARGIIENCGYAPLEGKIKVYILDEVHKLSNGAQNALLKPLEDTPPHVYFLLLTTDPDKVIKTIHTRCTSYQVKKLKPNEMAKLVKDVIKKEGVENIFSQNVLSAIVRACDGCPRQALVILDAVIDVVDEAQAISAVMAFNAEEANVKDICQLLIENKRAGKWKQMSVFLQGFEEEPESARYAILGYLSKVLMGRDEDRIANMIGCFIPSFMYSKRAGLVQALYFACKM